MVAVNILAGIIRFNPVDFVIANVQTQGAAATAFTEQALQTTLSSAG